MAEKFSSGSELKGIGENPSVLHMTEHYRLQFVNSTSCDFCLQQFFNFSQLLAFRNPQGLLSIVQMEERVPNFDSCLFAFRREMFGDR